MSHSYFGAEQRRCNTTQSNAHHLPAQKPTQCSATSHITLPPHQLQRPASPSHALLAAAPAPAPTCALQCWRPRGVQALRGLAGHVHWYAQAAQGQATAARERVTQQVHAARDALGSGLKVHGAICRQTVWPVKSCLTLGSSCTPLLQTTLHATRQQLRTMHLQAGSTPACSHPHSTSPAAPAARDPRHPPLQPLGQEHSALAHLTSPEPAAYLHSQARHSTVWLAGMLPTRNSSEQKGVLPSTEPAEPPMEVEETVEAREALDELLLPSAAGEPSCVCLYTPRSFCTLDGRDCGRCFPAARPDPCMIAGCSARQCAGSEVYCHR